MKSSRRLSLSPAAEDDIRYILQHSVQAWGEPQRDAYAMALATALDELGTFPNLGRARDDVFPGCRSHPVVQHVVYYRIEARRVRVLRILHAKMSPKGRVEASESPLPRCPCRPPHARPPFQERRSGSPPDEDGTYFGDGRSLARTGRRPPRRAARAAVSNRPKAPELSSDLDDHRHRRIVGFGNAGIPEPVPLV